MPRLDIPMMNLRTRKVEYVLTYEVLNEHPQWIVTAVIKATFLPNLNKIEKT